MESAASMDLRDMLDETARMLSEYETEAGTKQSFGYEVEMRENMCVCSVNIFRCDISTRKCSSTLDFTK